MNAQFPVFLSLLIILPIGLSYRILCVFPIPSRSHNTLGKGIVDALLKAGHEVTWVSPFPDSKTVTNRTVIPVPTGPLLNDINVDAHNDIVIIKNFSRNVAKIVTKIRDLREALVKTQFDAVVTDWFFSEVDAGYAAIQKIPWIIAFGTVLQAQIEDLVDDSRSNAILPLTMMNNFPVPMNLWQRAWNYFTYITLTWRIKYERITKTALFYESLFSHLAEARGVDLPPFFTALQDISIVFVNSHPSIAPARSLPPNIVEIAGFHIQELIPPLPKDIQKLLDSSDQGVIYFSMGSVLKSTEALDSFKQDLVKMFEEIPYTVLWKFEENIEGLPKNVHVRSWMPQASILAHPNVKLFITHGGQLSSLEAIYHGVPLLSVPVFGDQPGNAERAITMGIGLMVPYTPSMIPELKEKMTEMLQNDSYYLNVKHVSKLFRNRPVPPSKLISHYVELAIESKGAHHLRSTARLYYWYERWMLDVIVLFIVLIIIVNFVVNNLKNVYVRVYVLKNIKEEQKNQKRGKKYQ